MLAATKTLPSALHYADVRDVGRAHILAAETPGASGRYIVGHEAKMPSKDITDIYEVPSTAQNAVRIGCSCTCHPASRCTAEILHGIISELHNHQHGSWSGHVACTVCPCVMHIKIQWSAMPCLPNRHKIASMLWCLQARFPDYDIIPGQPGEAEKALNNSKAQRELGLHLMPLSTSFIDMAVTIIDLGVVTPKQKWEKWQNGKGEE